MQTELYEHLAFQFLKEEHRHHSDLATGLVEEALEVAETEYKDSNLKRKLDELSDVLWYVAIMANKNGSSLADLMEINYQKLERRELNGKKFIT